MTTKDAAATGFTAVNGETRKSNGAQISWSHPVDRKRSETPQPDEKQSDTAAANSDATASAAQNSEELSNLKRKRADVAEEERPRRTAPADVSDREISPEPRASSIGNMSASVSHEDSMEREERGRISSPPRSWNKGSVPRQAQPETQALLAEQLASAMKSGSSNLSENQKGKARAESFSPDRNDDPGYGASDDQDENEHGDGDLCEGGAGDEDQQHSESSKKRKRQFSQRTKTGCLTCRRRKKKCDEAKPSCKNCDRGGFTCGGYGAKPTSSYKVPTSSGPRHALPLQSKPSHEHSTYPPMSAHPAHHHGGPPHLLPPPQQTIPHDAHGYSHSRPPPPSHDQYPPYPPDGRHHFREPWGEQPYWYHHGPPPPPGPAPPTEPRHHSRYSITSDHAHPHESAAMRAALGHPPEHWIPSRAQQQPPPSLPPLPTSLPPMDPWSATPPSFRPSVAQPFSSARSGYSGSHGSGSQRGRAAHLSQLPGAKMTEKEKMIIGKPFSPFFDPELRDDRKQCHRAVDSFNDARRPDSETHEEDIGRRFRAIVEPSWRKPSPSANGNRMWHEMETPPPGALKGTVGHSTQVEAPFRCDYGYNLHLGDKVFIGRGCVMEDACKITIGNKTIIGTDVKFMTQTASVRQSIRGDGAGAEFIAGAITVGEGCFIGNNVLILPYRKIGNNAVVGAGAVVTKDVDANTVVVGNPARVVRQIEEGSHDPKHRHEIQKQNERMKWEMIEDAKREHESER
nr:putative maltose o-acetyltransferase [Quercus suber]